MSKKIKQNKNSKVNNFNHDSNEPELIKCNCGLSFKTEEEQFIHKEKYEHKEMLKKVLTIEFN